MGTYKGLLLLCECTWGVDCTCRWWGHLASICFHQTLFIIGVRALKSSLKWPLPPSPPLLPFCPLCTPVDPLPLVGSPNHYVTNLFPSQVVGILKPSLTWRGEGRQVSKGSKGEWKGWRSKGQGVQVVGTLKPTLKWRGEGGPREQREENKPHGETFTTWYLD